MSLFCVKWDRNVKNEEFYDIGIASTNVNVTQNLEQDMNENNSRATWYDVFNVFIFKRLILSSVGES